MAVSGQWRAVPCEIAVYHVGLVGGYRTTGNRHADVIADNHRIGEEQLLPLTPMPVPFTSAVESSMTAPAPPVDE